MKSPVIPTLTGNFIEVCKTFIPQFKSGCRLQNVGVSPSGKATDSDSVMRRFESCYPSQLLKDLILLNQVFCNLCVCKCALTGEFCTKEKREEKRVDICGAGG